MTTTPLSFLPQTCGTLSIEYSGIGKDSKQNPSCPENNEKEEKLDCFNLKIIMKVTIRIFVTPVDHS